MVDRVYMRGSPPRLITSKAGFNASPSLPDENKSFDSDWFNGCGIKWRLNGYIAPGPNSGLTINFPYQLNYIPYVVSQNIQPMTDFSLMFFSDIPWPVQPSGPAFELNPISANSPFTVTNSSIVIPPRNPAALNPYNRQFLIFEA